MSRLSMEDLEWLDKGRLDDLVALVEEGPLEDGDVPSKQGRNALIERGFAQRIVVKGDDGFTAATILGARLYCMFFGGTDTIAQGKVWRIAHDGE